MIEKGGVGAWGKKVREYMVMVNIGWDRIRVMSREAIIERVNNWELEGWRSSVEEMYTLRYYRKKGGIGGEVCYDNSWGAVLLFRSRTDSLRLGWRERFLGGDVSCSSCGVLVETLEHFLVECETLRELRLEYGIEDVRDVMCFGGEGERVKRFLEEAWRVRVKARSVVLGVD